MSAYNSNKLHKKYHYREWYSQWTKFQFSIYVFPFNYKLGGVGLNGNLSAKSSDKREHYFMKGLI